MRIRFLLLLLIGITFFTYLSSFWNVFVWDDEQFIYKNLYVVTFDVAKIFSTNTVAGAATNSNYYRPLTTLSFAADAQFWGLHEFGFHLTNTFIHIAAGILLFFLLSQLKFSRKASFWITLIFLLHPLQTEAVTYINSRGDSLYSFWALVSLNGLALLSRKKTLHWQLYNLTISLSSLSLSILTVLSYLFSILSKEIGIASFGLEVILVFYILFSHSSPQKALAAFWKNPIVLMSIFLSGCLAGIYLFLRGTVLNFSNSFNFYSDKSFYGQHIAVRLLTFTKVIWIYWRLLLVPYPLYMERSTELVTSILSIWPLLTVLALISLLVLGLIELKKKQTVLIWFGTAWFLCMLAPVSGIVAINGILYEHWLYLPLVGFFICLYGLANFLMTDKIKIFLSKFFTPFLIFICLCYVVLVIRQNYFWSTPIRFYEHLLHYTASSRVYNNLAMAYADVGQREAALAAYQKSLEWGDFYPQVHHNMGNTYRDLGKIPEAITEYKKALTLDPHFFFSYNALLELYLQQKMYPELLAESQVAFQASQQPQYRVYEVIALNKLGKQTEAQALLHQLETELPINSPLIATTKALLAH